MGINYSAVELRSIPFGASLIFVFIPKACCEVFSRKIKLPGINARSIGIFDSSEEVTEIPLLGYISAGGGLENIETPEPIKMQQNLLLPTGQHFELIVPGLLRKGG